MDDSKEKRRALIRRAVDTAFVPIHAATSKPAQKAYLRTALFAATSFFLLCVASIAYWLFYYSYVPQVGIERVIHLQFGAGNPYGTATLSSALTSQQAYDVSLFLHLPRTPNNLAAGNFMLDLSLLSSTTPTSATESISSSLSVANTSSPVLARSRRPAILTYSSPVVHTASTLSGLLWYVLGWKKESEMLVVPMFEGVEFAKGSVNVPKSVKVIVTADEKMQFYEVGIRMTARFGGLRWALYHHRILSFFLFTTTFWTSSILSMLLIWVILSTQLASSPPPVPPKSESDTNGEIIKSEPTDSENFDPTSLEDLSDTSRTFPTFGHQMPLHFAGRKKEDVEDVKKEDDEVERSMGIQPLATEADDEGDDEGMAGSEWRDSGIGTSREEERLAEVRRRRKALMGGRE